MQEHTICLCLKKVICARTLPSPDYCNPRCVYNTLKPTFVRGFLNFLHFHTVSHPSLSQLVTSKVCKDTTNQVDLRWQLWGNRSPRYWSEGSNMAKRCLQSIPWAPLASGPPPGVTSDIGTRGNEAGSVEVSLLMYWCRPKVWILEPIFALQVMDFRVRMVSSDMRELQ